MLPATTVPNTRVAGQGADSLTDPAARSSRRETDSRWASSSILPDLVIGKDYGRNSGRPENAVARRYTRSDSQPLSVCSVHDQGNGICKCRVQRHFWFQPPVRTGVDKVLELQRYGKGASCR